jgi:hypothetical protein
METFIDDVAEYLETNGVGTIAEDIFVDEMPPSPDDVVMVAHTGGLEADRYLPIANPTCQVTVRNTTYSGGITKIYQIFNLLHQKYDNTVLKIGGVDVMKIDAMQEPTPIGRDEASRHIFTCNFVFMIRR